MSLISARSVSIAFGQTAALNDTTIEIASGEHVALMGPSGSGKSTLLHCLGGVLVPDSGEVWFDGGRLDSRSARARSQIRLERMGIVFQFGDLVPELTLAENVMLPLVLRRISRREARRRAEAALDRLQISDVANKMPREVAGGQAQRAAVARAVVHRPALILADEPTGSLDSVNAETVLDVLVDVASECGAALVVVTHDHRVASQLGDRVLMRDGSLTTTATASGPW